jgi:hypothetical protein
MIIYVVFITPDQPLTGHRDVSNDFRDSHGLV